MAGPGLMYLKLVDMKIKRKDISAKANQRKRTFTIRVTYTDGTVNKYRTCPMTRAQFESDEQNTKDDWWQHLKCANDYYVVT